MSLTATLQSPHSLADDKISRELRKWGTFYIRHAKKPGRSRRRHYARVVREKMAVA